MSSHLQIITELETVCETRARVIRALATRLAELDAAYRRAIGGDEWPD